MHETTAFPTDLEACHRLLRERDVVIDLPLLNVATFRERISGWCKPSDVLPVS